jgi:hypothetical protein
MATGGSVMSEADRQIWEQVVQMQREQLLANPPSPRPVEPPQTIHYTELPEDTSDGLITKEWNYYRREVGRLLADGKEGKWVLIKGEEIVGIWDTMQEANLVRLEMFSMQAVLMKQILTQEPVLRTPTFLYRSYRNKPTAHKA